MRRASSVGVLALALVLAYGTNATAAKGRNKQSAETPAAKVSTDPALAGSHWLDEANDKNAVKASASSASFFAIGTFVLLLSAGAIVVLYRKNPRALVSAMSPHRIDLLAVRSLGGRQKLCLVETMGERMLIAVGETDATLLSHLPGGALPTAAEADGDVGVEEAERASAAVEQVVAPQAPAPAPAPAPPPAATAPASQTARWMPEPSEIFRDPRSQSAAPAVGPRDARPLHNADVAGLSRWRGEAQADRTPS